MAYNDKKILEVLVGDLGKVPERCEGYRDELTQLLADVLAYEREHTIAKTNVVKKITDQVNSTGKFLHKNRAGTEDSEGGS